MAFPNSAISDIIATTIQSRTGQIADNVTSNNALLGPPEAARQHQDVLRR